MSSKVRENQSQLGSQIRSSVLMLAALFSGLGCMELAGDRSWATICRSASGSNNHLTAVDKALAFTHGLLCEARKLTHVAYFHRDPMVPELLGIRRVASQSSLSRFFAGFTSAGTNLRSFRPLWRWCVERILGARRAERGARPSSTGVS
jgi:hypothetical protein